MMETCFLGGISRLVVLLALLETPCAGSYTASTGSGHAEWTAASSLAEFVSFGTGGTEGRRSDPVPVLPKEREPRTDTNTVPKHNMPGSVTMDTEGWESHSQTASTYIFSAISRAGERTLLSVITDSTSAYTQESNSSEASSQTFSQTYQTSTRTISQTSVRGSHTTSQQSSQTSQRTQQSSQTSQRTQQSSQTSQRTQQSPHQTSSDTSSPTFFQPSSQNSSQSFPGELSTASQDLTDVIPSSESGQLDTAVYSHHTMAGTPLNGTGQMDPSQVSLDTIGPLNSTLPMSDDGTENANVTQFNQPSKSGITRTESSLAVSSMPPDLSTEDSITNTSHLENQRSGTLPAETDITTEPFTGDLNTDGNKETATIHNTTGNVASTEAPPVVKGMNTTADRSLTKVMSSQRPHTTEPVQSEKTTGAPPGTESMVTHTSQLGEGTTYRSTPPGPVSLPPTQSAPSTTAQARTLPTTHATVPTTEVSQTRGSTLQDHPPSRTGGTSSQTSEGPAATSRLDGSTVPSRGMTQPSQATTLMYRHTDPVRPTTAHASRGFEERTTTEGQITTAKTPKKLSEPPGSPCYGNVCLNGGTCVLDLGGRPQCECLSAWTGQDCSQDVDECVTGRCPSGSECVNTRGSFSCECPLGFDLENSRTCTRAKTFLGTFSFSNVNFNSSHPSSAGLHEIQREILLLLNSSLATLKGYGRSALRKNGTQQMHIAVVSMFSMAATATRPDVLTAIRTFLGNCSRGTAHCGRLLGARVSYRDQSLCQAQAVQCDMDRTECEDTSGVAVCQCRDGYFKHSRDDLSCRECGDGFKLENGTCVPCMFGFGGFNCENFYKLIAVVVSPAGGGVLLILVIALIVTCCRKDKNDINKIIFKSGDLQMCSYPEYPKGNRVSVEWGREAIEMQENGSTKNLLQMTDIYYTAPLRHPEWPSRQSCIYPAQWNPSFISDDTRRRDYF
ncbi:protein HEG [Brienomyrus brachyistius]|uniref:protein HEG n=1 Tax=Brienomyrus brachyistius TaxID=42636 RepID=UPI0020B30FDB|nr:protein HEG [Brienomyrus brachyistius]